MSYQAFGEVALLCNIPQPFAVTVTELCQVRWRKQQLGLRKDKDSRVTVQLPYVQEATVPNVWVHHEPFMVILVGSLWDVGILPRW